MKTTSAKAKMRRHQNRVADMFRGWLVGCDPGDVKTASAGQPGNDIILSPKAKKQFGFDSIECKNQERLNIWEAIRQAKRRNEKFVVFFTRNHEDDYVVLRAKDFFDIL